ncbi:hypothetical protein EDD36DRAFT_78791 [Exophiala viscosa]|uniref:DUF1772-domain-containing protein n=1 Tax=Exophiala viscosa TaxID=2486360 RepID=A0AAN6I9K5_9EURO|nr:hypothetical protein EDD36DRAFT_78791 [Exophiala viscosa]
MASQFGISPGPLAGTLGIGFSAIFVGANLAITYITVPVLLLPSRSSPLPPPANAANEESPTSTHSKKPASKPSHLAQQWAAMYSLGSKGGPVAAILASGCYIYTARTLVYAASVQRRLLYTAAALSVAIVPFTFGVMKRTNDELHRRAHAADQGEHADAKVDAKKDSVESYATPELMRWWSMLNILRATLHVGAIGCAMRAMNL